MSTLVAMKAFLLYILIGLFFIFDGSSSGGVRSTKFKFHQDDQTIAHLMRETIEYVDGKRYFPNWFDLSSRPLPKWYDQAKIGFLIHWGVYSVPAFYSEWFWKYWMDAALNVYVNFKIHRFLDETYGNPKIRYLDLAYMFKAEKFNADQLADFCVNNGAKYVILTAKHHDGFALFPSKRLKYWNSVEVGPKRDIVGEVSLAVRRKNMTFGIQYSLYEWFNQLYLNDKKTMFKNHTYRDDVIEELKGLVIKYGPSIIWSGGDWEASSSYWKSTEFLSWLYNDSPVRKHVVVNDRWGRGLRCIHGDFSTCVDHSGPPTLRKRKWEVAFSIDRKSWGYRSDMQKSDLISAEQIVRAIVQTVSTGGNVLMNIGLTKEGEIPVLLVEILHDVGKWLKINGDAIYNTSPWFYQTDPINDNVWYTCNKAEYNTLRPIGIPRRSDNVTAVYAIFMDWPDNNRLKLKGIAPNLKNGTHTVEMLGYDAAVLEWGVYRGKAYIVLPKKIRKLTYAWVIKFTRITDV